MAHSVRKVTLFRTEGGIEGSWQVEAEGQRELVGEHKTLAAALTGACEWIEAHETRFTTYHLVLPPAAQYTLLHKFLKFA